MIPLADYASFLATEYLRGFVDLGGAAVKFAVPPDDDVAAQFSATLRQRAEDAGFVVARVDAAETKVHMIEHIFFEVSRQVDWGALAAVTARRAAAAAGFPVSAEDELSLDSVAARYEIDGRELKRDIDRELQRLVYRDFAMVQEFRIAMLRLCQATLRTGQVSEAEHSAVLAWLRGELRQLSVLKSALIFRRIARHNARLLLFSLSHWLSVNDRSGLVLEVDIRRLVLARRPAPEERVGVYYTRAAVLDAYEVLRQLVDNTDELSNCAVVVIAAPEFLTDANRGLDAYQALKLRIFDEVRDVNRDNPYSSLIRLAAT